MITALIYGLLAITGFPVEYGEVQRVWHVRNESRLVISGESNMNDFRCEVDRYYSADNLRLHDSQEEEYIFSQNEMVINLMEFDCGRKLITRDFRESLNADRNPEMIIRFLSLDKMPADNPNHENEKISGSLNVNIAGVTKDIKVDFKVSNNGNGTTYLNGSHHLLFSDFDLVPPTKMWGLINVKNDLEVTFNLVLQEVE